VLTQNNTFYNISGTTLTAPPAATVFGSNRTFLTPRQLQLAIKFDF
jgi:hypothetical protein